MSSFFIPKLGSQIYTMAGMRTKLHLLSLKDGKYYGLDTQYNGNGFSDMYFQVKVVEPNELEKWFQEIKQSRGQLTLQVYQRLIQPSMKNHVQYFSSVIPHCLFQHIIMQYKKAKRISNHWIIP